MYVCCPGTTYKQVHVVIGLLVCPLPARIALLLCFFTAAAVYSRSGEGGRRACYVTPDLSYD